MNDATMLRTIAQAFAPRDEGFWNAAIASSSWTEFLDCARGVLQGDHLIGDDEAPVSRAGQPAPFKEYLSDGEASALFAPPSFAELRSFAARHFTGGLPTSAMPVESLYVEWTSRPSMPFSGMKGLYSSDVAAYMKDMARIVGFDIDESLASYPDHLSVELGMAASLIDEGRIEEAHLLVIERTAWLTAYRARLIEAAQDESFHLALVDIVVGARSCLIDAEPESVVA